MNFKFLAGSSALALLIGLSVVVAAPAVAASTFTVCASDCGFTTIQSAVDAADAGDTVTVRAGTYAENVVVNKPLTITSEVARSTVIEGSFTLTAVTTLTGFRINLAAGQLRAVNIAAGAGGSSILNNTIDGVNLSGTNNEARLIWVNFANGTDAAPTVIQGNTFRNFIRSTIPTAIFIDRSSYLEIVGNTMSNATARGSAGVNVASGTHILVEDNTISNVINGIVAHAAFNNPLLDDLRIVDNTITNTGFSAIILGEANLANVEITGNTLSDISTMSANGSGVQVGGSGYSAFAARPDTHTVLIGSNSVTKAPRGVVLNSGVRLSADETFEISNNAFRDIARIEEEIFIHPSVNAPSILQLNNPVTTTPPTVVPTPTPPVEPAPTQPVAAAPQGAAPAVPPTVTTPVVTEQTPPPPPATEQIVLAQVGATTEQMLTNFRNANNGATPSPVAYILTITSGQSTDGTGTIQPTVDFDAWMPWTGSSADQWIDVWAYSTPTYIGTFPVINGVLRITGADFSALQAGDHHLVLVGQTSGSTEVTSFTIAERAGAMTDTSAADENAATPVVAEESQNLGWLLWAAIAVLAVGIVAAFTTIAIRRRRA